VGSLGHNQRHLIVEEGGAGGSTLAVDPTNVVFGSIEVGASSSPAELTLTNQGADPIDVTDVTLGGVDPGEFSHDFAGPVMIPGGGMSTFNVTFSPTSAAAPGLAGTVLYRVNAGGALVSDWLEDSAGSPSSFVNSVATTIHATTDPITLDGSVPAGTPVELFASARADAAKGAPDMEWDFPVTIGDELTIRLFFAEITRCQAGNHVFDVVIEGETVLDDYDPFTDAGCKTGTMKEFVVTAGDANLDIDFPLAANSRPSILSAIEVATDGEGGGSSDVKTASLTIEHSGLNGSLNVALTGTAASEGGGNLSPTAAFTFEATDLNVDFTDGSSDPDGTIVSWEWDFGDGNSSTEQNPSHSYAAAGDYDVSLTVMDDGGLADVDTQEVTVSEGSGGGGDGAFMESGGMAVMEAENFHAMVERSGHGWTENTEHAGFSGAAAMASTPDDGLFVSSDVTTTSPEISFDVDISTTGNYYLWVRTWSVDTNGNSVYLGMDGGIDPMSKGMQSQGLGQWVWLQLARGTMPLTHNAGSAGVHTVHVWMREDGMLVDKVVMTTDAGFVPTGEGPAESPQAAASKSGARGLDQLALQDAAAALDLPEEFALNGNYPNPFNPTTTINFDLPEAADVRLEVYDLMGRRVATLISSQLGAGRYEAQWNARSDGGAAVASGVYLYRLQAGSFEEVKRMVLMK
jgi:PKD repeat protein